MRRRRSPKVTWLPTLGTTVGADEVEINVSGLQSQFEVTKLPTDVGYLGIYPLTVDQPSGEDPAEPVSLADAIGSEYFLRRIVGKLFINTFVDGPIANGVTAVAISAGFFVARSDYTTPGLPAGATMLGTNPSDGNTWASFSPLDSRCMREPWIWRRNWILSVNGWDAGGTQPYPSGNVNYGISSLDGPHIDAKTRRRVSNDDRLYFAIAGTAWPFDFPEVDTEDLAVNVQFWLDYRLVGSLRKARNRGVF